MPNVNLPILLARTRPKIEPLVAPLAQPWPAAVLFFSVCDGTTRAKTITVTGPDFSAAWANGIKALRLALEKEAAPVLWLRVDWVDSAEALTWGALRNRLAQTKRNYFRHGLSLDTSFQFAFLETELNANAMLYGGPAQAHAIVNEKNFQRYASQRHKLEKVDFADDQRVHLFSTCGAFSSIEDSAVHLLTGKGLNAGRRDIARLGVKHVRSLIQNGSRHLAAQVTPSGRFLYGWHPCFDRKIEAYNALRHASTLYAMLEAWEVTREGDLKRAIDRGMKYLLNRLLKEVSAGSQNLLFLVEANGEIKLGGNAVCLLALVKYCELTGSRSHHHTLERLALGILHMQDAESGKFRHVLDYPSLATKQDFRIIYYDGEAAFGLMRLYGLTKDPRWLGAVERAFDHFIEAGHWQAHDHWLSYCVNELTLYRPKEAYFRFGLRNVADYLDFVLERITTFPTLLELMAAAQKMIGRLEQSEHCRLLAALDVDKFYRALEFRAHYLLNGHFWPELAMFFANPERIAGSFFIRHHAFRVRIDDVEHYLSGFVAYLAYLQRQDEAQVTPVAAPHSGRLEARGWTAKSVEDATNGTWHGATLPDDWTATGLCTYLPSMRPGNIVVVRGEAEGSRGILPAVVQRMQPAPAAVIADQPFERPGVPVLHVDDTARAITGMGHYARSRMTGKILAVTGSAGKTTTVAMLAHALAAWGPIEQTEHNANLPVGVAWNLACMPWDTPHIVLELAIGRMGQSARMARPHVAVFTNVFPAHLGKGSTIADIARAKSAIFSGMAPGSVAVLNRDMHEWTRVHAAASQRGLKIIHFGQGPDSAFRLLHHDAASGRVTARCDGRQFEYRIGAAGVHMALNSVAVLGAVAALGHPLEPAIERLAHFKPLPGRGEELELAFGSRRVAIVDDAYNANPGSMAAALRHFGERRAEGRRIAILGEMADLGPDASHHHAELINLLKDTPVDRIYAVGERYETAGDPGNRACTYLRSAEELKTVLPNAFQDGDCVLIKGSHATHLHKVVAWLKSIAD